MLPPHDSSVNEALAFVRAKLKDVSDAPDLDAQWLVLKVLGKYEVSWLLTHNEEFLSDKQGRLLNKLAERRKKGEPLAYILEEWGFYGRKFYVNKDVLVPRPSTESLIDKALDVILMLLNNSNADTFVIADIGTGSGCIIITLALELVDRFGERSNFSFIATDISPLALDIARKNAEKYSLLDKIEFRQGDMLDSVKDDKIDLIVSNPPYVPSGELALPFNDTERIGLKFEPEIALDGGSDGQQFLRIIKTAGIPAVVEGTGGIITTA